MFVPRLATIRQCLMAFGAALVLPGLVFAAVLLWNYASSERSRYEEEGLDTALRIMAAVDRELVGIQAAAKALATLSSLLPTGASGEVGALVKASKVAPRFLCPEA